MSKIVPNKPILFFICHESEWPQSGYASGRYEVDALGNGWQLAYMKPAEYIKELESSPADFAVSMMQKAIGEFGPLQAGFETFSRDMAARFYVKPTVAHFLGLALGWSMVDTDGEEYEFNWIPLDSNVWHGDVDSVLLNVIMPKCSGGACGCGDNHDAVLAVVSLLESKRRHPLVSEETRELRLKELVYPDTALGRSMLFINYVVDAMDLTEHGSSVNHGWLSTKGILYVFLADQSIKETAAINAE